VVFGCSRAAPHTLRPLPANSATLALVDGKQQVIHGQPCPSGFIPSEMPGDWCYRLGSVIARPSDLATKAAYLDRNWVRWVVAIRLRPAAAKRFARLAGTGGSRTIAIVANGEVVAALPRGPGEFPGGVMLQTGWILDGQWKPAEARRIEGALGGRDISAQYAQQTMPIVIGPPPSVP
jgi:hypothetical protein